MSNTFQDQEMHTAEGDKSRIESYEPPKYVIEPAKGDKGFFLIKGFLNKVKKIMTPGIWSTT